MINILPEYATITNSSLEMMVKKAISLYSEKTGLTAKKVSADLGKLVMLVDGMSFEFKDLI